MAEKAVIIHYHELALKGGNRAAFENVLILNLQRTLAGIDGLKTEKRYGRLIIKGAAIESRKDEIKNVLKRTFGIANFYFGQAISLDIQEIEKASVQAILAASGATFKIDATRSNKNFALNSMELNREIGAAVLEATSKKVDIKDPDIVCSVMVSETECYVSCEYYKGVGGLPVGTSGKMLALLSGGIDSPIAAWKMMRRGAAVDFIHFHSYPYTNKASIEKVKELAAGLKEWGAGELYLVPFIDIQKQIMTAAESRYRVLLYRRFMLRIAGRLARETRAQAIITGENLGQVASQTIENMSSVEKVLELPILRPLVGENKEDIINEAKKIGTYEISIRPHEDCCTLFVPKNPATKSRPEDLEREEVKLEVEELVKNAVERLETIKIPN